MKKGLKKCLSIVLTIAMLVSVMSVAFVVNAAGDTVTINGTEYKVGDTIEVKKEITVKDKWLMEGQVTVPYDNTVLEFVKEDPSTMFPVLNGHAVVWNDTGSAVKFNFTDIINGVDFTSGGVLYDFTFKVKAGSDTEVTIDDNLEVISTFPFNGDPQSEDNKDQDITYPFNSAIDGDGNIPADKGTEGKVEVTTVSPETLTVNDYKAKVGETVYISKKIQVKDNWVMNGQVTVTYDPAYLKFAPTTNDKMFPNIYNKGLIYNDVKDADGNPTGEIRFNFTDILTGCDFTKEAILYDLPFTVIKGSDEAKKVTDTIEAMSTFSCVGDPSLVEGMDKYTSVSVVDDKTGEIDSNKGTSQDNPVVADKPGAVTGIVVNGVTVVPGDEVNHYIEVQNAKWFANGQFEITYNNKVLELVEKDDSVTYPVISKAGASLIKNIVDNGNGTSTIYFNFTTLSGVDFSTMGRMFDFYFTVKEDAAPGNYTIDTNIVETYVFDVVGDPAGSYDMINIYDEATGDIKADKYDLVTEITAINLDALNELIAKAEALAAEEGYTQTSIDALKEAITAAKAVAQAPQSQDQIDETVTALQAAMDAVEIDTSALDALITKAEEMDTTGYTEETKQALTDAITAAKAVAAAPESVQAVKDEITALQNAIDGLEIDTSALDALVKEAEAMDTDGYTADSVKTLTDAITAAKAEVENPTSVQAVADAKTALQNAMDGLKIDTSALEDLITKAEAMSTTGYTADSVKALTDAIAAAKAVAADPESVKAVADQITALQAAMDGLKVDTTALEAAIAAATPKLDDTKYSPTSREALKTAVDAGNALLAKIETEFVSYEDVAAATEAINTAVTNLVEGVILGDANGDGMFNIDDATWIQRFLAKLVSEDKIVKLAADVNKDGKLTVMDATMAQVRLATNTPIEYVFSDEP